MTLSISTKQKLAWSLEPPLSTDVDSAVLDFVLLLRRLGTVTGFDCADIF